MRHPGSNVTIELLKFDRDTGADPQLGRADRIGLRHLAFAVTDIDATVARLHAAGVEFLSPIQTWAKTGKRLVYLTAPTASSWSRPNTRNPAEIFIITIV